MKVFEACLIVIKRRITTFIVYFAVFLALAILIPALAGDQMSTEFSQLKPNITVINRDGDSSLTDGLMAFLREQGNKIALEDDKRTLQDATFYRATDYIVFLPQGFHDSFISGAPVTLDKVVTTESAKGYYADSLVNRYLNLVRVYLAAGSQWDEGELVSTVLSDLSLQANAVATWYGSGAPMAQDFLIFSRMLPYILLVLSILVVTNITLVFKRPDIRMRNMSSPLRPRTQSWQQILCCSIMCVIAWLLMVIIGFIIYGSSLDGVDGRLVALLLLNSFVFTVVALSISALIGSFARSPNAQNAAANVVGLGLCFLGGVFVPLEMFGEGLLSVARFLPTFWTVTAIEHIGTLTSFEASSLGPIWQALLIQLVFAAAFFCVTLLIGKHQNQSEKSFGSIRTELEA